MLKGKSLLHCTNFFSPNKFFLLIDSKKLMVHISRETKSQEFRLKNVTEKKYFIKEI